VSGLLWRKDGECGGSEEAGARGLKEGGDGEEKVREGSIRGRPEGNRERKAREVNVSTGSSGEDGSIGKSEEHGWSQTLRLLEKGGVTISLSLSLPTTSRLRDITEAHC
jgi:hypothetical protein